MNDPAQGHTAINATHNRPEYYHAGAWHPFIKGAIQEIKVLKDAGIVAVGDGIFQFHVARDIAGMNLVYADAMVSTPSTSGVVTIQVYNSTQTQDMLSVRTTIDQGEETSFSANTQHVVDTSNDDVALGDEIWINVDTAGTGAKGLEMHLTWMHPTV